MLEYLAHPYSLLVVFVKHFLKKVFCIFTDAIPLVLLQVYFLILDVEKRLVLGFRDKRHPACEQSVEHDAQTPHISGQVMWLLAYDLWGKESYTSHRLLPSLSLKKNCG